MVNPVSGFKKFLRRHLTVILIPHTSNKPLKTTFSISFLIFIVLLWTGLTIWATYLTTRHIDYWRLKFDRELIKFKLLFFANELKKSQELLAQVKEKDQQLRELLDMKTKKAIVTQKNTGQGGPSPSEQLYFQKLLERKVHELSVQDLYLQAKALREETRKQLASIEEINGFISYQRALYNATPNMWPCSGNLTSPYGFRVHPLTGNYEFHTGIDISNSQGTKIYATADGVVKYTGWAQGYGKLVVIEHGFGYETYYAHLWKILVKQGQKVLRGEVIGLMGETGTTTGIHLHYEVWVKGKLTNPKRFLDNDIFFSRRHQYGFLEKR
ncbi:MAG: M23 family metallopeptidase [Endomicrobiia bacterium]